MIIVAGAGLPGLASAARLAREGHQITLFDPRLNQPGPRVSNEPGDTVITLPAAWRDLFYKSGRILDAELGKRGLSLAPAPAREFRLADGGSLYLTGDRGQQWTAIRETLGEPAAVAWRDLLDHFDQVWQVLRRLGMEAEFDPSGLTREVRAVLRPRQSLAALAGTLAWPELAEVLLDVAARLGQDPARLPGWHGYRLSVERTFGRWQVVDADGAAQPASVLAELLLNRVEANGVELRTEPITAIRRNPDGLTCRTESGELRADVVISTLDPAAHADLTDDRSDGRIATRLVRAPGGGPRWDSWRTLTALPGLTSGVGGVITASAWSPAGPDAWAQLLTGALASYRVHADLTGADIRPTNKAYRRPVPLRRNTTVRRRTSDTVA